jgi:hypothetical protein
MIITVKCNRIKQAAAETAAQGVKEGSEVIF